jgi:hypothetical protein
MTTSTRIRRVSSPAYYLARPAAFWLAAFSPQPRSASCVGDARGPAADLV